MCVLLVWNMSYIHEENKLTNKKSNTDVTNIWTLYYIVIVLTEKGDNSWKDSDDITRDLLLVPKVVYW